MERKVGFSGGFCLMLAGMVLLLPLRWVLAFLIAAGFHEICHWLAILLCSGRNSSVEFHSYGARMFLPPMKPWQEALCALAGPAGGLALGMLSNHIPRIAVCAAIHSLYNLLPMYPLDGGRALQSLLCQFLHPTDAQWVSDFVGTAVGFALLMVGIFARIRLHLGPLPLLVAAFLLLRTKFSKTPCKTSGFRVQ